MPGAVVNSVAGTWMPAALIIAAGKPWIRH